MELLLRTLLIIHIACGSIAFASGLLAIISRKGGPLHQRSGSIFFWCMVAVGLTAVIIAGAKGNAFLLHIGLFALYMAHAGWRSIRNKRLVPALQDWAMLAVGAINGLLMVATLNVVMLVFGGISLWLAQSDVRTFIHTARGGAAAPKAWLRRHIGMMLGTYIATTTAFLLTALRPLELGWWLWLAPTFIGVPLIMWFTSRHATVRKRAAAAA